MSEKLSILDDSSDSEVDLKINKNYADRYNVWRNREELQKYKDLKKADDDSDSSSESEEAELPDEEFNENFHRAISLVKGGDPRLLDKNMELFKEKEMKKNKTVKEKPMYTKDYERDLVLKRGGRFSDEEDEHIPPRGPTYNEQQEDLKKSFKALVNCSDEEDVKKNCKALVDSLNHSEEEDDDLLQVRKKTNKEEDDDEADYVKWLKGEEKEVSEEIKKDVSHLRNCWNDPNLKDEEKFLRDYFLNETYLEKDEAEIPSYDEITGGSWSDIDKELETFEHKYQFRFEEPDEEYIKHYPRCIGDSLRKADNRRKQKRVDKAERRRREREQRQEELKRLKALKRKEIEEKFLKLQEISGQDKINFNESDMESDFDPDKHDKKMGEMFNDDYYDVEEVQKPEFPFDEELDAENWNTWTGRNNISDEDEMKSSNRTDSHKNDKKIDQPECSTNSENDFKEEMIEATLPKKKVKKKSLFSQVISQPKPIYDPEGKSFDDYLDEYYKLDYEDIIGDMPVRYKYRKVIPNDFGLTVDEILSADDKELNRWCSVKKTCQYRNDEEEMYDIQAFKKKSQNILTKKKLFSSLYAPKETEYSNEAVEGEENYTSSKTSISTAASTKNEPVTEDAVNSFSNGNIKHDTNQHSFIQNSETKKKSKKKKCKENLHKSHTDTDCEAIYDKDRNVDSDSNKNSLKFSSSLQYDANREQKNSHNINQQQNASKKKKHKEKCNTLSNVKTETEGFDVTNKPTDVETYSNLEISKSKRKREKALKRKREAQENEFSDSETNVNKDNVSKKKLKDDVFSNINDSPPSLNSNFVGESSSQEVVIKKKKKKRKKKKKGASIEANTNHIQQNVSKCHRMIDKKSILNTPANKRLGLSDSRLESFGVNPKKLKNKIIYSQK